MLQPSVWSKWFHKTFPVHSLFPKKMHPLFHILIKREVKAKLRKNRKKDNILHRWCIFSLYFYVLDFQIFLNKELQMQLFISLKKKKTNLLEVSFKDMLSWHVLLWGLKSQERVTACHILAELGVPQFPCLCNGVTTITTARGCNGVPFSHYWKGFIPMPGTSTCSIYIYY